MHFTENFCSVLSGWLFQVSCVIEFSILPMRVIRGQLKRRLLCEARSGGRRWIATWRNCVKHVMVASWWESFGGPESIMSRVVPPTAPWKDTSADLLGTLPILVEEDYFSRFLEVTVLKSTTNAKIVEAIHPIFPRLRFLIRCGHTMDLSLCRKSLQ